MYQQISVLDVSANNGKQLIQGLNKISLLIEINGEQTFQNGDLLERVIKSGRVFGCRWIQGQIKGQLQPLEYGQHEILLDVPNPLLNFDLEIVPNRYQFNYQIKIYAKTFNPRFNALSESLGIPTSMLQNIPEQTLLILEGINLMANTDTRTTLAKIEAIDAKATSANTKADAAQSKADLTADSLVEAKSEMVLDRRFELTQAMFVLENGFMVADVTHDLTAGKPQMSLTDAQGDEQGFAQLIAKSPTVARVELSQTQYNDNSYPMTFLLQGSKGTASMAAQTQWLTADGRGIQLDGTTLKGTTDNGANWQSIKEGVTDAHVATNKGTTYYKTVDGSHWYVATADLFTTVYLDPANWIPSLESGAAIVL